MDKTEEKKKISEFEFAIMQAIDENKANKEYVPLTKEEEAQLRVGNLKEQASKLKIKR